MDKKRVFDREEFAADLRDVSAHLQRVYRKHFPDSQHPAPNADQFQLMVQVDLQQQIIRQVAEAQLVEYVFGTRGLDYNDQDQATLTTFETLYGMTFVEALQHAPDILLIYLQRSISWDEAVETYLQKWKRLTQANRK